MRWFHTAACALFLVAVTPPARAAGANQQVRRGVAAYEDLDYQKAVELLEHARKETLARADQIVVHKTLAACYVVLDRTDLAEAEYKKLLVLEPKFELDRRVSPRMRAVFEKAHGRAPAAGTASPAAGTANPAAAAAAAGVPATLDGTLAPARVEAGQPVSLSAACPRGAQTLTLHHRKKGAAQFSSVSQRCGEGGNTTVSVPGLGVEPPGIDYYLVAADARDAEIATRGTPAAPLTLAVAAPASAHRGLSPWVWVAGAGGLAVGAAVVGVAVALASAPSGQTPASLTIMPR